MKLISSPTCTKCRQFKQLIKNYELPVEVLDINRLDDETFDSLMNSGIQSLPVLLLNKDEFVSLSNESQSDFLGRFGK